MKKAFKIIIINLIIFVGILGICEYCLFKQEQKFYKNMMARFTKDEVPPLKYNINKASFDESFEILSKTEFRKPSGEEYNRPSIVILGGSYIFGYALKDNETVNYQFAKETKRPTYNRGIPGAGIQHAYFQVCRDDFASEVKTEPAFIIYPFIYHFDYDRLIMKEFDLDNLDHAIEYSINKKNQNGDLVLNKGFFPKYIRSLYIIKYIRLHMINKFKYRDHEKNENLLFELIKRTNDKALQKFPNAQFIILNWENDYDEEYIKKINNFSNKLKENGLTVYSMTEITGVNFADPKWRISETDDHPNAEYWKIVVPKLAKSLNLY